MRTVLFGTTVHLVCTEALLSWNLSVCGRSAVTSGFDAKKLVCRAKTVKTSAQFFEQQPNSANATFAREQVSKAEQKNGKIDSAPDGEKPRNTRKS